MTDVPVDQRVHYIDFETHAFVAAKSEAVFPENQLMLLEAFQVEEE